jgi:hypothetical protein
MRRGGRRHQVIGLALGWLLLLLHCGCAVRLAPARVPAQHSVRQRAAPGPARSTMCERACQLCVWVAGVVAVQLRREKEGRAAHAARCGKITDVLCVGESVQAVWVCQTGGVSGVSGCCGTLW